MFRLSCLLASVLGLSASFASANDDVVFRSDVSLVRVDVQVLDRNGKTITGLAAEDFALFESGRPQEIRNFASEETPLDVLLLLDVSGSMQPHVERVQNAASDALRVLGSKDRVAVMVFDRSTRVKMQFTDAYAGLQRGLDLVMQTESFDGGTDIQRGLLDASSYVQRNARRGARKAIVILTDDETERGRDQQSVLRALRSADAVLSAILAPNAASSRRGSMAGGWPGSYPRGPLGGIIFGRRGPLGGGGPVYRGGSTQPFGTAEVAQKAGGDSTPVSHAYGLSGTFESLRQRYALHFYLPDGVRPGQERDIEVQLSASAARRYPGAEVRYRREYIAPGGSETVTSTADPGQPRVADSTEPDNQQRDNRRRRRLPPRVDERQGPVGADSTGSSEGGWRRAGSSSDSESAASEPVKEKSAPAPSPTSTVGSVAESTPQAPANPSGGWRRIKPGEQP